MALDVLLDSTYLLPSFGIEVEGLSNEHIRTLREAWSRGLARFYCLSIVWIEVIGKVCREARKSGLEITNVIDMAIKSLLESGVYKWVNPTSDAIKLAFKLRLAGHKDVIDNLLYATSITSNIVFLTMDKALKDFLIKHGFNTENIMDHRQLLRRLGFDRY
ncbi:MAG: hypothetical protein DRN04_15370 [Thermoprotei archaeon]|nr:MAG: hypothetical protein DRN04_15370 [Thermoprotei archaeon]